MASAKLPANQLVRLLAQWQIKNAKTIKLLKVVVTPLLFICVKLVLGEKM